MVEMLIEGYRGHPRVKFLKGGGEGEERKNEEWFWAIVVGKLLFFFD